MLIFLQNYASMFIPQGFFLTFLIFSKKNESKGND